MARPHWPVAARRLTAGARGGPGGVAQRLARSLWESGAGAGARVERSCCDGGWSESGPSRREQNRTKVGRSISDLVGEKVWGKKICERK